MSEENKPELMHPPFECPSDYRTECDGTPIWSEDPFQAEIYDDHTEKWMCKGFMWMMVDET